MPELPVIQNLNPTVFKTTTSAAKRLRRPAFREIAFPSPGQGFDVHCPYQPHHYESIPLRLSIFPRTSRLTFHAAGAKGQCRQQLRCASCQPYTGNGTIWDKRLERVSRGNLMFERYWEKARRVIFFARYVASQYGSPYIETEHLLLGLLREDRALAKRFLGEVNSEEGIRAEIERHITSRERISTSVEVPLTLESKKILNLAAEESDRLGHRHIGTEHILLGLLRVEDSLAGKILQASGVRVATLREQVAKVSVESSNVQPKSSKRAMVTLDSFLAGLKWHKAEELLTFFAENAQFVDVYGKRWNRAEIQKEFETLFAPYAKKNAAYLIEETLADTGELLIVIVLWKNAILASLERVWIHRMSVVLVPQGDDWAIMLAHVTPVHPK